MVFLPTITAMIVNVTSIAICVPSTTHGPTKYPCSPLSLSRPLRRPQTPLGSEGTSHLQVPERGWMVCQTPPMPGAFNSAGGPRPLCERSSPGLSVCGTPT